MNNSAVPFRQNKSRPKMGLKVIALFLAGGIACIPETNAQTFTWNNGGTNGWSTPTNWTPSSGVVAGGNVDYVLRFNTYSSLYTSTNNFVAATGPFSLNSIVLTEGSGTQGATIQTSEVQFAFSSSSISTTPSIVQNSSGNFIIAGNGGINLVNNLYLRGNGSGLVTLRSVISGSNGLILDGSANYALTTVRNTYTGGTTVNTGTLRLSNLGSVVTGGVIQSGLLGTGSVNFNGGTITASSSTATAALPNAVNIGTSSTVAFGDLDASYNGAVTFSGTVMIGQNTTVLVRSNLGLTNVSGPTAGSNVTFDIADGKALNLGKLDVSNNVTLSLTLGATTPVAITGALTGTTGDLRFVLNGGVAGNIYTLLTFGNNELGYSDLVFAGGSSSLDTTFGIGGWLINGNSLQVKVVPEPSTWAMALLSVGALVLVGRRARLKVRS